MDAGDVLLEAHRTGFALGAVGSKLLMPDGLPSRLERAALHWRNALAPLLSLPVATLCQGMTDDEREAFNERAAIIEHVEGFPRELAERAAVWWARTPCCERRAVS